MASTRAAAARTLPARYAKFLTACAGEVVAYLQLYGATWHLVPAVTMAGVALAVLGVPNAPKMLEIKGEVASNFPSVTTGPVTYVTPPVTSTLPPPPASEPGGTA